MGQCREELELRPAGAEPVEAIMYCQDVLVSLEWAAAETMSGFCVDPANIVNCHMIEARAGI